METTKSWRCWIDDDKADHLLNNFHSHFSFFKTIDWDGVRSKDLKPPIVPKFGFSGDTRNFEEYAETDWINVPEASAKEERLFRDF